MSERLSIFFPLQPPPSHLPTPPFPPSSQPLSLEYAEVPDDTYIRKKYGPRPDDEWTELKLSWRQLPKIYLSLSKHRITSEKYVLS